MAKQAIVTGATRGIGRAISLSLLKNGYGVVGLYEKSDTVAEKLKKENTNLELYKVDLSDRKQIGAFIQKMVGKKLDLLVNNAGIYDFDDVADNFDISKWDRTIAVNLEAPIILVHGLKNQIIDGGSVINIVATDINVAAYGNHSYAASKSALANLTKSWAGMLAERNIRVNALSLGWVDTDMGADDSAGLTKLVKEQTMLGRIARPEEVAEVVTFLASDKASYVTAAIVNVDGGYGAVDYVIKKEG